jgi:membrane protease YdiL (CAAX protease family)
LTASEYAEVPSFRPLLPPEPTASPEAFQPGLRSTVANVVLALDLLLIGILLIGNAILGVLLLAGRVPAEGTEASPQHLLWSNGIVLLLLFGLLPALWVLATRKSPVRGFLAYLGFTKPFGHATFVGVGLAGCMLVPALLLVSLWSALGLHDDSASLTEHLFSELTWPLIVFVAVTAGVSEEIFFRGLLYRWLGWWGQAPIFVLAHLGGGEPVQLFATLLVGLLFGWLRRIGWSLWTLVVAHAVYNFTLLAGSYVLG